MFVRVTPEAKEAFEAAARLQGVKTAEAHREALALWLTTKSR